MTTQTIEEQISILDSKTQEYIEELKDSSYDVEDMIVFINEHGEESFRKYYEQYCELGEIYHYNTVDEFIQEFSIDDLEHLPGAFHGDWSCFKDFAENMFDEFYLHQIPREVQPYIDYDSYARDLEYDYLITDSGYVFSRNF